MNVGPEWVQGVFGVQSAAQIDIDKVSHTLDKKLTKFVCHVTLCMFWYMGDILES